MEEILASIRRIIADDEAKPADRPAAAGETAGVGSPRSSREWLDMTFLSDAR